jgi:hypothetical protein
MITAESLFKISAPLAAEKSASSCPLEQPEGRSTDLIGRFQTGSEIGCKPIWTEGPSAKDRDTVSKT